MFVFDNFTPITDKNVKYCNVCTRARGERCLMGIGVAKSDQITQFHKKLLSKESFVKLGGSESANDVRNFPNYPSLQGLVEVFEPPGFV